ncbi:MAG: flagellar protein FlgN [Pseudomonadota bacterium]
MMTSLQATIDGLCEALADFTALLEEESAALAAQDAERLSTLLPRREAGNRELAEHWRRLAEMAGPRAPAGLASLRGQLFGDAVPPPAWQRLEQLAHDADRLNRVNARMLDEQMRRTQTAMQVLQNTLSSRSVYGSDGRVTGLFQTNRSIDSA